MQNCPATTTRGKVSAHINELHPFYVMDFADFLKSDEEFESHFGCLAMRTSSVDIIVKWMMDKGKRVSAKEFAALSVDEVQELKNWFRLAWEEDIQFWLHNKRQEGVMPERMIVRFKANKINALNEDENKLIPIWEYTKQLRPQKLDFTCRNSYFVDLS